MQNSEPFKDHFSHHASLYAKYRPQYPEQLYDFLFSLSPNKGLAWDCGTGNGQAAIALSEQFSKVIATDASQQQIEQAPSHPRVTFRTAPAELSGIDAKTVNLTTVATAAHWFEHDAFHAEVRRVSCPDAHIAVWSYELTHVCEAVDPIIENYYRNVLREFWPEETKLVRNQYRDLPFPFEEIEPPKLSIKANWTLKDLLAYHSTWSATQKALRKYGNRILSTFESELASVWGDPNQTKQICWPLMLRVGKVSS